MHIFKWTVDMSQNNVDRFCTCPSLSMLYSCQYAYIYTVTSMSTLFFSLLTGSMINFLINMFCLTCASSKSSPCFILNQKIG